MPAEPGAGQPTSRGARVLALLGDSVTTDHISPAGSIKRDGPAGVYLQEQGVEPRDFNSYGSRRGNHEVMMRGTFANIRLRNLLGAGAERCPKAASRCYLAGDPADAEQMPIYDAAMRYIASRRRRWSCSPARSTARAPRATGPPRARRLLGVRAVIAESFERIHRSNLVGMGVLPLQFPDGQSAASLGLNGEEVFSITGSPRRWPTAAPPPREVPSRARAERDGRDERRSSSTRACASTRRARPSTSATAASCSTCCARCSPR